MTQYQIAKKMGVSHQAVSKWYSGKSLPSQVNLVSLAKILNKDIGTILNEFLAKKAGKSLNQ